MRFKAYKILYKEEKDNIYLNLELKNLNEDEDIKNIVNRVYGVVQNDVLLSFYVDQITERRKLDLEVQLILKLAFYEELYLDSVPRYAIISEYTKLTKKVHNKSSKYIAYILNNDLDKLYQLKPHFKDEFKNISIKYSHPKWLVKDLYNQYQDEYLQILEANITQKDSTIRVLNKLQSYDGLEKFLFDDFYKSKNNVIKSDDFKNNNVIIQDIGSYLVTEFFKSSDRSEVLDLCSAPGSKTMHLSKYFQNVYSNEINESRFNLLNNNLGKYGIINVSTCNVDARDYEQVANSFSKEKFKNILVDAPCSGIGTLRSKPEIKKRLKSSDITQLTQLQYEIFSSAIKLLDHDGHIIYSTCSINKKENEEQIKRFINDFDLEIVTEKEIQKFSYKKNSIGVTILPQQFNSDGFFMCKLKRK